MMNVALVSPRIPSPGSWYSASTAYRAISLENLYVAGPTQATEFLEIMDAISLSCAKMKQVWNTSSMAVGGRDDRIQKQLEAGGHIYARYINGTLKDAGIISLRAS